MKKFILFLVVLSGSVVAQAQETKLDHGGKILELQYGALDKEMNNGVEPDAVINAQLETNLKSFINNIYSEEFKKTVQDAIDSYTVILRNYPISYQLIKQYEGKGIDKDDVLLAISGDKKTIVVFAELYNENRINGLFLLINFMITDKLKRDLTKEEEKEFFTAFAITIKGRRF